MNRDKKKQITSNFSEVVMASPFFIFGGMSDVARYAIIDDFASTFT